MTEAEWLNSTAVEPMLAFLRGSPRERLEPFFGRFARLVEYPERRTSERVVRLPIAADGCLQAIETAEQFANGAADEDGMTEAHKVAVATQSLVEFYMSVYDSSMGPMDFDLAATGEVADAVIHLCGLDEHLDQVPGHAARAVGLNAASRGEPEETTALAEAAAQCVLLREMVGNPFARTR